MTKENQIMADEMLKIANALTSAAKNLTEMAERVRFIEKEYAWFERKRQERAAYMREYRWNHPRC